MIFIQLFLGLNDKDFNNNSSDSKIEEAQKLMKGGGGSMESIIKLENNFIN